MEKTLVEFFKALKAHNVKLFQVTVNKSQELLENIFENGENFFMSVLGELNGLISEQGTLSIGRFIETTKEKAIIWHTQSALIK